MQLGTVVQIRTGTVVTAAISIGLMVLRLGECRALLQKMLLAAIALYPGSG
jgi:hypothetical protein